MTSPRVVIAYDELESFCRRVFEACGVPGAASERAAAALCFGDLVGNRTHGVANLSGTYVTRLDDGRIDATAACVEVARTAAAVVLDAQQGLGLAVGCTAIDLACDLAREQGIGACLVRNSSHLGCLGYYTSQASARGLVGIAASNCGRQRIAPPPGGAVPLFGTNPFSVSAPAGAMPPFLLDMSTTVVPTGRIRAADRQSERIPEGWMIDRRGLPVTDPAALESGDAHLLLLGGSPTGGAYKGLGLTLLVDILCGALAGSAAGPKRAALSAGRAPTADDEGVGHSFIVIDPGSLRGREGFGADMAELLSTVADCPPLSGEGSLAYPGLREAQHAAQVREAGVELMPWLVDSLTELADRFRIALPTQVGR